MARWRSTMANVSLWTRWVSMDAIDTAEKWLWRSAARATRTACSAVATRPECFLATATLQSSAGVPKGMALLS